MSTTPKILFSEKPLPQESSIIALTPDDFEKKFKFKYSELVVNPSNLKFDNLKNSVLRIKIEQIKASISRLQKRMNSVMGFFLKKKLKKILRFLSILEASFTGTR